ncbi:hypothetical protein EKK58_00215 [Candidatus Dependentiae bacterium]|nr:MAG: hypothetical protein EKK58_00215 [Candidatus Dependentiae bacterium]
MTLHIELDEEAEKVDMVVDDHLVLRAERRSANHISYKNFDSLVDDRVHDTVKEIAAALLNLTD